MAHKTEESSAVIISFRTRLFVIAGLIVGAVLSAVLVLGWSRILAFEVERLDARLCMEARRLATQPFHGEDIARLEADIVARAPDLLAAGNAELVRYDTRASDESVMGLGMGCQGIIDVLLEPLGDASLHHAIGFYGRLAERTETATVLTLLRSGVGDPPVGTRLLLDENGGVVEGDRVLLARAQAVASEVVSPATRLVICGGGTDAIPLARCARELGWHVTVVDHRTSFVTATRFPDADALVCVNLTQDAGALGDHGALGERTVAVVMAHSASHDRAYLHAMLDARARYIGVLGPRRRTLELLGDRASSPDGEMPASVHSPVGLDLGAETPEEIAVSIVAEILAVTAGRRAGMLRERHGPIHDRGGAAAGSTA